MYEREQPERMQATASDSDLAELIRSSVATYGEPAPNSELAQRILMRIAAEARPVTSRRWLAWAVAVPLAACLIAFLVEWRPAHTPSGLSNQAHSPVGLQNSTGPATSNQLQPGPLKRPVRKEVQAHVASVVAKTQSLPMLDVFPTPQPLTPAEQALVDFATQAPISERKSLIEAQQKTDAPLTIAAIEIQPIELPELGTH